MLRMTLLTMPGGLSLAAGGIQFAHSAILFVLGIAMFFGEFYFLKCLLVTDYQLGVERELIEQTQAQPASLA